MAIDVTALSAWEAGRYSPREQHRASLASVLGVSLVDLFTASPDPIVPASATTLDTIDDLPQLLTRLLAQTHRTVKDLRVAAPYTSVPHAQPEFRSKISARILNRTVEVQRVEIFYNLERLKEVLGNIIRYDGCQYYVHSVCAGLTEVFPGIGGYIFDDEEILLGGYWGSLPANRRPGLRLSGEPFRTFFREYWHEIWGRGVWLNVSGVRDLSAVRELAVKLGLDQKLWPTFVEEARAFDVGDGAPPRI